jgi:outer membrane immunogenic protein
MKLFTLIAASAAIAFAGMNSAEAQTVRAELGYTYTEQSNDAVTGRLGVDFNDFLGAEAELNYGINTVNSVGAYGVVSLPILDRVSVAGRAGWAVFDPEFSVPGFTADGAADGFAYGLGARYTVNDRWSVRGDWTRVDVSGQPNFWGATLVRQF